MNEVLQTVLDYVQTPHTDYALLITGPWGCGKTYFWKNVVEPKLTQLEPEKPWRPMYASLYGCRSAKDIDTQLLLASYPHLRQTWATRLSTVGGHLLAQIAKHFTGVELPAVDLRWLVKTEHAVLCFDDLERTRLSMTEALGYINTFVEQELVKTVILCNEDAIDDEADKKTYATMKEKVVGASLTFRPDLATVFDVLIGEHKKQGWLHAFLLQNAPLLRLLFERSDTSNVRSLRRAIAALAVVCDVLRRGGIDLSAIARQLIYAAAPTAFELHGRRVKPARLRSIHTREYMSVIGASGFANKGKSSDEGKYEAEYAERYLAHLGLPEWKDAVGCPPICEFMLTGFLDRDELLKWASELTRLPDEKEERIKQLSFDARGMDDETFTSTAAQVLEDLERGDIADAMRYVSLYSQFEWFADARLIALTREELVQNFTTGLRKAEETGRLRPDDRLRRGPIHPAMVPQTDEGRTLLKCVQDANERVLAHSARERVRAAASRLNEDPSSFIDVLTEDGSMGLLRTPVFQELDADAAAARILAMPNALKLRFWMAMEERYAKHVPPPEFAVELPVLMRIRDLLKNHCQVCPSTKSHIPMSRLLVQEIVGVLDRAILRLEQLKQPKEHPVSGAVPDQADEEQVSNDDDVPET